MRCYDKPYEAAEAGNKQPKDKAAPKAKLFLKRVRRLQELRRLTNQANRRRADGAQRRRRGVRVEREVRPHHASRLATRCAASCDVMTGWTSNSTRSLQFRVHSSRSARSAVSMSW